MNSEEIKQQYSMKDIVEQYGFKVNRMGFINCPFHKGDRGASLKVYQDSFHCFGCGKNGDIFTFVQLMDSVDFKTAFQSLGGTYEKPTFSSQLSIYRAKKKKEERARASEKLRKRKELNNMLIDVYRGFMNRSEPFSEVWCDCCNALQYQLYLHEILNGEEVTT
jgi:DNA primase